MLSLNDYIRRSKLNTDDIVKIYLDNLDRLDIHNQIHFVSRMNLLDIDDDILISVMRKNAGRIKYIVNNFDNYDKILDEFVCIGYKSNKRKKDINNIFKDSNIRYKKYLCLNTLIEMIYTFERTNTTYLLDDYKEKITKLINDNIENSVECILEDKYNLKEKASTKYINSIYFLINVSNYSRFIHNKHINKLKSSKTFKNLINACENNFYNNDNIETALYGITHLIIGESDFYTKKCERNIDSLLTILKNITYDYNKFKKLCFDLQVEICLILKLFGNINIYLQYIENNLCIDIEKLEENEHTNVLYILLKKYEIK